MSKRAVALAQFVEQVVSQFVAWFGGSIPPCQSVLKSKMLKLKLPHPWSVCMWLLEVAGWWRLVVKLALSAQ